MYIPLLTLFLFMLIYAAVLVQLEDDWDYFTSLYFTFITMSTIGFGDIVPKNPVNGALCFLMGTLFGLILLSMFLSAMQRQIEERYKATIFSMFAKKRREQELQGCLIGATRLLDKAD